MTALSGLAMNFWHLLIARIGVGVGEAGCSPSSHAIIADYYSAKSRATALGIYSLGIPVGILFGFYDGRLDQRDVRLARRVLRRRRPGTRARAARALHGREPRARHGGRPRRRGANSRAIVETLRYLLAKRSFRHLAFGGALTAFVGYGFVNWMPSFLIRSHGMTTGRDRHVARTDPRHSRRHRHRARRLSRRSLGRATCAGICGSSRWRCSRGCRLRSAIFLAPSPTQALLYPDRPGAARQLLSGDDVLADARAGRPADALGRGRACCCSSSTSSAWARVPPSSASSRIC